MKTKDIFGLIVRTLGLAAFAYAFWYLYSAIFMWLHSENMGSFTSRDYIAAGLMCALAGCFLLRKADWVANFAYPTSASQKTKPENDANAA